MMTPVHRLESAVLSAAPIILVCRPPPRGHRRQGPAPPPRPARPNPRSPGPCAGRPGPRSTGCAPPRRPAWSCPAPLRSGPMRRRRPGPTGRPTGGRSQPCGRPRRRGRGAPGTPPWSGAPPRQAVLRRPSRPPWWRRRPAPAVRCSGRRRWSGCARAPGRPASACRHLGRLSFVGHLGRRGGEGVPPPQFVVADDGGGQGVLALQVVRRRHAATVLSGQLDGQAAIRPAATTRPLVAYVAAPDGATQERLVPRRVVVGNLGYDVSFTLPKSYSLLAFRPRGHCRRRGGRLHRGGGRTFGWLEASAPTGCAATTATARARPRWPRGGSG